MGIAKEILTDTQQCPKENIGALINGAVTKVVELFSDKLDETVNTYSPVARIFLWLFPSHFFCNRSCCIRGDSGGREEASD